MPLQLRRRSYLAVTSKCVRTAAKLVERITCDTDTIGHQTWAPHSLGDRYPGNWDLDHMCYICKCVVRIRKTRRCLSFSNGLITKERRYFMILQRNKIDRDRSVSRCSDWEFHRCDLKIQLSLKCHAPVTGSEAHSAPESEPAGWDIGTAVTWGHSNKWDKIQTLTIKTITRISNDGWR